MTKTAKSAKMMAMALSAEEFALLGAMKRVQYGDLYDVELELSDRVNRVDNLAPEQARFIEYVRKHEIHHFKQITVHQGNPATMHIEQEIDGFRTVAKIRV